MCAVYIIIGSDSQIDLCHTKTYGRRHGVVISYRGKVVDVIAATLHILPCGKASYMEFVWQSYSTGLFEVWNMILVSNVDYAKGW